MFKNQKNLTKTMEESLVVVEELTQEELSLFYGGSGVGGSIAIDADVDVERELIDLGVITKRKLKGFGNQEVTFVLGTALI